MCKSARTRKVNMDIFYLKNRIRTKKIKHVWTLIILLIVLVHASASHIDFDDVETSWLRNIAVHVFPIGHIHASTQALRITGLASTDIEDGIHIKPTFSTNDCISNETELEIIKSKSDLIVSLNNFHFKQHSEAYLCIKTKYDDKFLHMGQNSKFSK